MKVLEVYSHYDFILVEPKKRRHRGSAVAAHDLVLALRLAALLISGTLSLFSGAVTTLLGFTGCANLEGGDI